jgi:hypothetical protein
MRNKIAFAWYRPEDWPKLLNISRDKDELEDTYDEWLIQAEDSFRKTRDAGMDVTKIFINLDELALWCDDNNLEINSDSRSNFAAFKLEELFSE